MSSPSLHGRGTLHRRLKDFNSAIDDYIKATELCEEEGAEATEAQRQLLLTYNDFAVHCYTKGFFEEAVLLLNKALKAEKNEKGLYVNRGGSGALPGWRLSLCEGIPGWGSCSLRWALSPTWLSCLFLNIFKSQRL